MSPAQTECKRDLPDFPRAENRMVVAAFDGGGATTFTSTASVDCGEDHLRFEGSTAFSAKLSGDDICPSLDRIADLQAEISPEMPLRFAEPPFLTYNVGSTTRCFKLNPANE